MEPHRPRRKGPALQKKIWISLAAVAVLAGAAAIAVFSPAANRLVVDTWQGDSLRETRQAIADPLTSDHWRKARVADRGVTIWDPINADRGFTLYTSGEASVARLVTMTGAQVHEWAIPYSKLWKKETAAVQEPQPDNLVFMRQARIMPNGDLIAVFEAAGHVPAGYGLAKLDRNSTPVWSYLQRAHGTFDLAPDGRVFALVQQIREDDQPPTALKPPFLEDFLVVLSPDGKETARISLVGALERSRYASLLRKVPEGRHDPLGATGVQYLGATKVKGTPIGAGDRVLLSLGGLGALAILDVAGKRILWAGDGVPAGEHHAQALADGDVLVTQAPGGKDGQVRQVDMSAGTVTWSYGGKPEQPVYGTSLLSAQRLGNGNTLLIDSGAGRLVEVDKAGTVVWEFTNPVRGGKDEAFIPVITSAQRVEAQALDSDFRGFKRP
jgi:hypothetical protein